MKNKMRIVSTILSLLLIALVLATGCTPQQRPNPNDTNRLGTRFDLGDTYNNNRYGYDLTNRNGYNGWYDRAIDKYGNNMTPNNRLYGYYGNNLNNNNDLTYDNIPNNMSRFGMNGTALRNKLETAVEGIRNVNDATVITNGDTSYVGVDTNGTNNQNMAALRTDIANKIRSIDPNIKRVYVTTDENRIGKLKNYANNIDAGKPIRNFLDDLEDLFR